jgi:hypothetical protein
MEISRDSAKQCFRRTPSQIALIRTPGRSARRNQGGSNLVNLRILRRLLRALPMVATSIGITLLMNTLKKSRKSERRQGSPS